MFIKRILLAMPIVLAIVTMNAMNPIDIAQAKELMNKALVDPTFYGPFKEHPKMVSYIAEQTEGFSGRDISYLILGLEKQHLRVTTLK